MNLIRDRSGNHWKEDIPDTSFGVEWWVGRKRMSGNYLPCVVGNILSVYTTLAFCGSKGEVDCLNIPDEFSPLNCEGVYVSNMECSTVTFQNPRWREGSRVRLPHPTVRIEYPFIKIYGGFGAILYNSKS